jgi:hypothetical protein
MAYITILHILVPWEGLLMKGYRLRGEGLYFPFSLTANASQAQLFSRAPSWASGSSCILQLYFKY